jgi:hypothetical protein
MSDRSVSVSFSREVSTEDTVSVETAVSSARAEVSAAGGGAGQAARIRRLKRA